MGKNCIVAQSGGPTAAINASLAGVISAVNKSNNYDKIYGSLHGIQGVLRDEFLDLSDATDDFIERLAATPAMYLGSCRYKLPDYREDESAYKNIFEIFDKYNVGAFFYIGGNDSMDTVAKLSEYAASVNSGIRIAGIPKTIDNDLLVTDHTPGFASAAKYVASSIREVAYDTYIYDLQSVTIIEVMGRDAGWLTGASMLARNEFSFAPHLIYLPEVAFDSGQFISDVQKCIDKFKNVIVAVSEGIHDADGNYIAAGVASEDKFGHAQLSGAGKALEYLVKEKIGVKVRSIEINVLQRAAGHMASKTDLEEAMSLGAKAVEFTELGETGFMTVIKRISDVPYEYTIEYSPVKDIANKAKPVPVEWINDLHNDVTGEFERYIKPLVEGEVDVFYKDGIVDYLPVGHLVKLNN
ncbi:MAG: 6-phosphofructokinase [Lachnospiraceae bacterium]|nr:6-phosphofructokinase [Lachnospiraceae bacterium]